MWAVSAVRAARVRARTAGRRPRLRCAAPFLLCEVGLPLAIAFPFDGNDFGVVGEAIDERDGAGRVRKDRIPLLEHQIGCQHDRFLFVAAADDLKQEVGRVGVVEIGRASCRERVLPGV